MNIKEQPAPVIELQEIGDVSDIGRVVEMKLVSLKNNPNVLKREKRIVAGAEYVAHNKNGQVYSFETDYRDINRLQLPLGWIQHGYVLLPSGFLAHRRISAYSEFGGEKKSWQLERVFTEDGMKVKKETLKINGIVMLERKYQYDVDETLLGVFDETRNADGARVRIGWTLTPSEDKSIPPAWRKFSEIIKADGREERHNTMSISGPTPIQIEYPSGELSPLTLEPVPNNIVFEVVND